MSYLALARDEGADTLVGGGIPDLGADLAGGAWIEPTLWAGLDNGKRAVREEVFGPVAALIPFDTEEEAVRLANDTRYGLAAAVWTQRSRAGTPGGPAHAGRHGLGEHLVPAGPALARSVASDSPGSGARAASTHCTSTPSRRTCACSCERLREPVDAAARRLAAPPPRPGCRAPRSGISSATMTRTRRTPCRPSRPTVGSPSGGGSSGRKIGLTSRAVQAQLGVGSPDFGDAVRRHGVRRPRADSLAAVPPAARRGRGRLRARPRPRPPEPTVADVIRATEFVLAAIEIVDSRIAGWDITIADTIADNASSGASCSAPRPGASPSSTSPARHGHRTTRRGRLHRGGRRLPRQPASSPWPGWPGRSAAGGGPCGPATWCCPARSARWSPSAGPASSARRIDGLGELRAASGLARRGAAA